MPTGIARKLIFYLTLMVVLVEGCFALIDINSQEKEFLREITLSADLASQTIVSTTWHAMLADRRESVYQMMDNVGRQENIGNVRIFNRTGRVMYSSGSDQGMVVDINADPCGICHVAGQPLLTVDMVSRTRIKRRADGGRDLGMLTPIYNEPSCSTADCHAHPEDIRVLGVIDVMMPLDRVDVEVRNHHIRSILLSAVSVVVVAFFVIFFTRRFVQQPVNKLIEATQRVGTEGKEDHLDIHSGDEIGDLARSFQSMQDRIRVSNQQIREFTDTLENKVEERTQQLRKTEEKLFQSDRLASLGQLSASVAHEINNPLAGVINFGKLMQRLIKDGNIPEDRLDDFRSYLDHVVNETVRCGNIVRDLVVFARQSAPRRSLVDFNEVIRRTLSVVHHRLELGEVTPETHLDPRLPEVLCDPSQVQQIVTNLVLNAAEAMEGGVVTISTKHLPEHDEIQLSVKDTGTGISEENLTKLFDPFFSTKEEGKGTGLGLAVVYGLVEAHHGRIDLKTKVGLGTTFTVILPVSGLEENTEETASAEDPGVQ